MPLCVRLNFTIFLFASSRKRKLLELNFVKMDFFLLQQVASILRQAGQDSIRLVVARPVDPSVPQFAPLNSTIVPTKVLTDPQGLEQALSPGLQASNGGYNCEINVSGNGPSYPEAYQVRILQIIG